MPNTLIVAQPKLWIVPKEKGVSELKMRPLGKSRFGGAGTLTTLTTCNDGILGNLALFRQDLYQIWCLQCTFMVRMVIGFDKKSLRPANVELCIFLSSTVHCMSADREVQELLREFE